MKKFLFIILLSSIPSILSAQVWVTAGYGFSWLNSDGFNYVIDRYNSTRNYLTNEMEQPGAFSGFAFNAGLNFVSIQMDVRYSFRSTQITSEGAVNGTNFKREVDIDYSFYGFGIGFGSFDRNIGYSFGVDIELVFPGIVTRINPGIETEVDMSSQFATAVSPQFVLFVKLGEELPLAVSLRPYYTFGIGEFDYSKLNETINPSTYLNDPTEKQSSKINGFGIELQFGLLTSLGF
jgi:hypothetical protein